MALKFQGGKAAPAVNAKKNAPGFRRPVYTMGDGIYGVEPLIGQFGDQELAASFRKLKQAYDEFRRVLDRKAIWD
jgi:hypothetical protein